jgi:hypothetical protein
MFIQEKLSTSTLDFDFCKIDEDCLRVSVVNFLYSASLQTMFIERDSFKLNFFLHEAEEIQVYRHSRGLD